MIIDVCTFTVPSLVAFLLLPSLLGLGTVITISRLHNPHDSSFKVAALQAAPLTAGSLASLVLLREPSTTIVSAIGALATLPFLATLYATQVTAPPPPLAKQPSFTLNPGHAVRKGKRSPSLSTSTSPSTTPTTLPPMSCTPTDTECSGVDVSSTTLTSSSATGYLEKGFKAVSSTSLSHCSRPSSRTSPGPLMLPPKGAPLTPFVVNPVTAMSSASTSASSTHNILSEAQLQLTPSTVTALHAMPDPLSSPPLAFETEFVRMLARSAARAPSREEPAPAFGSWPKEWPIFWEGAGLSPKGCW